MKIYMQSLSNQIFKSSLFSYSIEIRIQSMDVRKFLLITRKNVFQEYFFIKKEKSLTHGRSGRKLLHKC